MTVVTPCQLGKSEVFLNNATCPIGNIRFVSFFSSQQVTLTRVDSCGLRPADEARNYHTLTAGQLSAILAATVFKFLVCGVSLLQSVRLTVLNQPVPPAPYQRGTK